MASRQRLRTFAAECREHHRTRDLRIQPRHDARGVPTTLRRRRQLHQHREARPSELLRFRAGHPRGHPDFNRKSLRSTVVLRWEYVPGSTLFFVWNLSTSDTSRPGVFSPTRDLRSAFSAPGTNVFAVKINYWLTP